MEKETFKTTDLDLATLLVLKGFKYTLDKSNPRRVAFIFNDKEKAEQIAKDFVYQRTQLREEVMSDG